MDEHQDDCDCGFEEARDKLAEAVREFVRATENDGCLVVASSLVFETTKFDENGKQGYKTQHLVLDGSLAHSVGLLSTARDHLSGYINRPNGEEEI